MTLIDDEEQEPTVLSSADTRPAGRFQSVGVPVEKSKDFKAAVRRLAGLLKPETDWKKAFTTEFVKNLGIMM